MDTSEKNPRTDSEDDFDLNIMEFSVLDECGTDEDDDDDDKHDNPNARGKNDTTHKRRRSAGVPEKRGSSHIQSPRRPDRRNLRSSNDRDRSLRSASKGKRISEYCSKDHRYKDKPYSKGDHSKERQSSRSRSVHSTSSHDRHSSSRKMENRTKGQEDKQKERQKSQSSTRTRGQVKGTHLRDWSKSVQDNRSNNQKSRHGTDSKLVQDKRQKGASYRRNASTKSRSCSDKNQEYKVELAPLRGFQVIDDEDDDNGSDDGIDIQIDDSLVEAMETRRASVSGMVIVENFHSEKELDEKQKTDKKFDVAGHISKQETERRGKMEEKECLKDKSMQSLSVTSIIADTEEVSETEEFLSMDELEDFTVMDDLADEKSDEDDIHITADDSILENCKESEQDTIDEEMIDINLYVKDDITEEDNTTNKAETDLVVVRPFISRKEQANIRKRGDDPAVVDQLLSKNIAAIVGRENKLAVTEDLVPVEFDKVESMESDEVKSNGEKYDDIQKEHQLNDVSVDTDEIEMLADAQGKAWIQNVTDTKKNVLTQNVTDTDVSVKMERDVKQGDTPTIVEEKDKSPHRGEKGSKQNDSTREENVLTQDVINTEDIIKGINDTMDKSVKQGVTASIVEEKDKTSHPGEKGSKQNDSAEKENVLTQNVADTEDTIKHLGDTVERDVKQGVTASVAEEKDKTPHIEKKGLRQNDSTKEENVLTQSVADTIHIRDITQNVIDTDKQNLIQDVVDTEEHSMTQNFTDTKEQNLTQHCSLKVLDLLPEDDDQNNVSTESQSKADIDQNMPLNTSDQIFQTFEAIEQIAKTMDIEYSVDQTDNNTASNKTKKHSSDDASLDIGTRLNQEQFQEVDSGDIINVNESSQSEAVLQSNVHKYDTNDLKTDASFPQIGSSKDLLNTESIADVKKDYTGIVHGDKVNDLSDVCCKDSDKLENILSNAKDKNKTENIVLRVVHDENINIYVDNSTDNVTLQCDTDISENESAEKSTESCTEADENSVLLNEKKVILRNVSDTDEHEEVDNLDDGLMLVAEQLKYIKDDLDKNEEVREIVGDQKNIKELRADGNGILVDEVGCVDEEVNFVNEATRFERISDVATGDVDRQFKHADENVDKVGFVDEDMQFVDEVIDDVDEESAAEEESDDDDKEDESMEDEVEDVEDNEEIVDEDLEAIDHLEQIDDEDMGSDNINTEDADANKNVDENIGHIDEDAFQAMIESEGITDNKGLVMVDEVGDIDAVEFMEVVSSSKKSNHGDSATIGSCVADKTEKHSEKGKSLIGMKKMKTVTKIRAGSKLPKNAKTLLSNKVEEKSKGRGLSQKPTVQKRPVSDHRTSLKERSERQMRVSSTKDNTDHHQSDGAHAKGSIQRYPHHSLSSHEFSLHDVKLYDMDEFDDEAVTKPIMISDEEKPEIDEAVNKTFSFGSETIGLVLRTPMKMSPVYPSDLEDAIEFLEMAEKFTMISVDQTGEMYIDASEIDMKPYLLISKLALFLFRRPHIKLQAPKLVLFLVDVARTKIARKKAKLHKKKDIIPKGFIHIQDIPADTTVTELRRLCIGCLDVIMPLSVEGERLGFALSVFRSKEAYETFLDFRGIKKRNLVYFDELINYPNTGAKKKGNAGKGKASKSKKKEKANQKKKRKKERKKAKAKERKEQIKEVLKANARKREEREMENKEGKKDLQEEVMNSSNVQSVVREASEHLNQIGLKKSQKEVPPSGPEVMYMINQLKEDFRKTRVPIQSVPAVVSSVNTGALPSVAVTPVSSVSAGVFPLVNVPLPSSVRSNADTYPQGVATCALGSLNTGVVPSGIVPPVINSMNTGAFHAGVPSPILNSVNTGVVHSGIVPPVISSLNTGAFPAGVPPPVLSSVKTGVAPSGVVHPVLSSTNTGPLPTAGVPPALSSINAGVFPTGVPPPVLSSVNTAVNTGIVPPPQHSVNVSGKNFTASVGPPPVHLANKVQSNMPVSLPVPVSSGVPAQIIPRGVCPVQNAPLPFTQGGTNVQPVIQQSLQQASSAVPKYPPPAPVPPVQPVSNPSLAPSQSSAVNFIPVQKSSIVPTTINSTVCVPVSNVVSSCVPGSVPVSAQSVPYSGPVPVKSVSYSSSIQLTSSTVAGQFPPRFPPPQLSGTVKPPPLPVRGRLQFPQRPPPPLQQQQHGGHLPARPPLQTPWQQKPQQPKNPVNKTPTSSVSLSAPGKVNQVPTKSGVAAVSFPVKSSQQQQQSSTPTTVPLKTIYTSGPVLNKTDLKQTQKSIISSKTVATTASGVMHSRTVVSSASSSSKLTALKKNAPKTSAVGQTKVLQNTQKYKQGTNNAPASKSIVTRSNLAVISQEAAGSQKNTCTVSSNTLKIVSSGGSKVPSVSAIQTKAQGISTVTGMTGSGLRKENKNIATNASIAGSNANNTGNLLTVPLQKNIRSVPNQDSTASKHTTGNLVTIPIQDDINQQRIRTHITQSKESENQSKGVHSSRYSQNEHKENPKGILNTLQTSYSGRSKKGENPLDSELKDQYTDERLKGKYGKDGRISPQTMSFLHKMQEKQKHFNHSSSDSERSSGSPDENSRGKRKADSSKLLGSRKKLKKMLAHLDIEKERRKLEREKEKLAIKEARLKRQLMGKTSLDGNDEDKIRESLSSEDDEPLVTLLKSALEAVQNKSGHTSRSSSTKDKTPELSSERQDSEKTAGIVVDYGHKSLKPLTVSDDPSLTDRYRKPQQDQQSWIQREKGEYRGSALSSAASDEDPTKSTSSPVIDQPYFAFQRTDYGYKGRSATPVTGQHNGKSKSTAGASYTLGLDNMTVFDYGHQHAPKRLGETESYSQDPKRQRLEYPGNSAKVAGNSASQYGTMLSNQGVTGKQNQSTDSVQSSKENLSLPQVSKTSIQQTNISSSENGSTTQYQVGQTNTPTGLSIRQIRQDRQRELVAQQISAFRAGMGRSAPQTATSSSPPQSQSSGYLPQDLQDKDERIYQNKPKSDNSNLNCQSREKNVTNERLQPNTKSQFPKNQSQTTFTGQQDIHYQLPGQQKTSSTAKIEQYHTAQARERQQTTIVYSKPGQNLTSSQSKNQQPSQIQKQFGQGLGQQPQIQKNTGQGQSQLSVTATYQTWQVERQKQLMQQQAKQQQNAGLNKNNPKQPQTTEPQKGSLEWFRATKQMKIQQLSQQQQQQQQTKPKGILKQPSPAKKNSIWEEEDMEYQPYTSTTLSHVKPLKWGEGLTDYKIQKKSNLVHYENSDSD